VVHDSDPDLINVLLVEDHLALRKGLALLLRREGIHVVGETDDSDQAVALASRRAPQVVILDLGLPGGQGLGVITRLADLPRPPAVLVYTGGGEALDTLLAPGGPPVAGVALKAGPPAEFVGAVRAIAAGGSYMDPRLAFAEAPVDDTERLLSRRESEILTRLATGLSGAEVASALVISPETVRTHIRNAMAHLGASTRAHAIVLAIQRGEIELAAAHAEPATL